MRDGISISDLSTAIDKIYNKAATTEVAVTGKNIPLKSVLDNIDGYNVKYYYKKSGNHYSVVMKIKECPDLLIEFFYNFFNSTIKAVGINYLKDLSDGYKEDK